MYGEYCCPCLCPDSYHKTWPTNKYAKLRINSSVNSSNAQRLTMHFEL